MKRSVVFLLTLILLYLIPSLVLQTMYGPSYGFLSGSNHWVPDGQGGWSAQGKPTAPKPARPSVNVPISLRYLPVLLPGLLLMLVLLTPLSRWLNDGKAIVSERNPADITAKSDRNR